jgi:uncharacterized metal-binding protein
MMAAEMNKTAKVGIISCSGEELAVGTISRSAVRRVLEVLRPHDAVTLCLPLFLAGNEGERNFARTHPTITIDGCEKLCARFGTERHGGPVARSLVVSEILGDRSASCTRSLRNRTPADDQAITIVADRIALEIDALMSEGVEPEMQEDRAAEVCACMKPTETGAVTVKGKRVEVPALAHVFGQCAKQGLAADETSGTALLEQARMFVYIAPEEEADHTAALIDAYRAYLGG